MPVQIVKGVDPSVEKQDLHPRSDMPVPPRQATLDGMASEAGEPTGDSISSVSRREIWYDLPPDQRRDSAFV